MKLLALLLFSLSLWTARGDIAWPRGFSTATGPGERLVILRVGSWCLGVTWRR